MAEQNKFLNLLGIAKSAGALSQGHDASLESLKKRKAYLCLVTNDASERLFKEFSFLTNDNKADLIRIPYTMDEVGAALSYRVAVLTVNNRGIADRLKEIINLQNGEEI